MVDQSVFRNAIAVKNGYMRFRLCGNWYAGWLYWPMFLSQKKESKTFDPRRMLNFTGGQSPSSFVCEAVLCRNISPFRFAAVVKDFVNAVESKYLVLFLVFYCKSHPKRSCCRSRELFDLFVKLVLCEVSF